MERSESPIAWGACGWGEGSDWHAALQAALAGLSASQAPPAPSAAAPDLVCLFASAAYGQDIQALLKEVQGATGAKLVTGCSGWGVIGGTRELEDRPALSLLALSLPGATFTPVRLSPSQVDRAPPPGTEPAADYWQRHTTVSSIAVNAWLLFVDPFSLDAEALVNGLAAAYPAVPLVGGLASGDPAARTSHLFLNAEAYHSGAVAIALGGGWTVETVVSQGCTPIGRPWTITGVDGPFVRMIARRPAYEVLVDTVKGLPEALRARVRGNLFAGLAMDERRTSLQRGDFLIRNLHGADPSTGALLLGGEAQLGQTIQFQLRDAEAADEDFHALLQGLPALLDGRRPAGALLCSCTGRGAGLFGTPDHDAGAVGQHLGPLPAAGFFCNGEIGPIGGRNFIHGYTASLALFVPVALRSGRELKA
ncbi:MAG TPA: FIST N-terminal domain-containing protein [Chloroflexota bacterium]|nr:FIST N-terminal domain-containing protein [Chloroflexota bacterium]